MTYKAQGPFAVCIEDNERQRRVVLSEPEYTALAARAASMGLPLIFCTDMKFAPGDILELQPPPSTVGIVREIAPAEAIEWCNKTGMEPESDHDALHFYEVV